MKELSEMQESKRIEKEKRRNEQERNVKAKLAIKNADINNEKNGDDDKDEKMGDDEEEGDNGDLDFDEEDFEELMDVDLTNK